MKRSLGSFIYILFVVSAILFFNFCAEKQTTEPPTSTQSQSTKTVKGSGNILQSITGSDSTKDSTKSKPKKKGGIGPYSQVCGTLDKYYWDFDHYETASGKIVGIWPEDATQYANTYKLQIFKDTLGFNRLITLNGWVSNAEAQGWDPANIMIGGFSLSTNWQADIINNQPSWAYYFDEPLSNAPGQCDKVGNAMANVRNYLNNNGRAHSLLIAGDTKPDYVTCFSSSCNIVMCTKYTGSLGDLTPDQRSLWTDFRNQFGSKFSMTWISSRKDNDEFDNLLGHASNLGLNGVWLFQADDDLADEHTERTRINTFCLFAWKWGFLKRIERQYLYTYTCTKPNPCDCDHNNVLDGWELENRMATSYFREVTY